MTEVLSRSPSTWNIGTTAELSQNVVAGVTKRRCQVVEEGVTAKAADEEETEGGAAEAESRRV